MGVAMYAGFWKRLFAAVIDGIILNIALYLIGYVIGYVFYGADYGGLMAIAYIIGFIGTWLYHAVLECSDRQATFGKQIIGIKVTNLNGERIGFGQASGRYFGMIISTITLGIGFLMAGWTKKKQGLHDIISGCLVVNKNYNIASQGEMTKANNENNKIIPDIYWKEAFEELSTNRDIGVWAKVFSENKGNDSAARADYLKIRAAHFKNNDSKTKFQESNIDSSEIKYGFENIQLFLKEKYTTESYKNNLIYVLTNGTYAFKQHGFTYFFDNREIMMKAIGDFSYYDLSSAILDQRNNKIK